MTRIISGRYRGLQLKVPAAGTRPTTDRVREALFSALGSRISLDGAAVLDLFAGSGALGIEAVSRGADTVWFFDKSASAVSCLRANSKRLVADGISVVVRRAGLPEGVSGPCPLPGGFDLVLIDPPYESASELDAPVLEALGNHGWLAPDALVVWERSVRTAATRWPTAMDLVFERTYGETHVEMGRW